MTKRLNDVTKLSYDVLRQELPQLRFHCMLLAVARMGSKLIRNRFLLRYFEVNSAGNEMFLI